jgi:hypothetical protein
MRNEEFRYSIPQYNKCGKPPVFPLILWQRQFQGGKMKWKMEKGRFASSIGLVILTRKWRIAKKEGG